jgi:hypothetical protein
VGLTLQFRIPALPMTTPQRWRPARQTRFSRSSNMTDKSEPHSISHSPRMPIMVSPWADSLNGHVSAPRRRGVGIRAAGSARRCRGRSSPGAVAERGPLEPGHGVVAGLIRVVDGEHDRISTDFPHGAGQRGRREDALADEDPESAFLLTKVLVRYGRPPTHRRCDA